MVDCLFTNQVVVGLNPVGVTWSKVIRRKKIYFNQLYFRNEIFRCFWPQNFGQIGKNLKMKEKIIENYPGNILPR